MRMKSTEQQLDNLFAAARSEEPIISQEDVRGLLEEHSTLQQSGNTIRRSLFTKKGITMTSILATGIAAIVAFSLLVPSTDTPATFTSQVKPQTASVVQIPSSKGDEVKKNEAKTSQPMIVIEDEDAVNTLDLEDTPPTPEFAFDEPIEPSSPLSPNNPLAPMEVKGVQIIKVEKEQLASFGVEVETDGGIAFFIKGDSLEYQKMILPTSTWGVILSSQAVKAAQLPVSVLLTPTLITDARGNRRMIFFKDNNHSISMSHSHQMNADSSFEDNMSISINEQKNNTKSKILINQNTNKVSVHIAPQNTINNETIDNTVSGTTQIQEGIVSNPDHDEIIKNKKKIVLMRKIVINDSTISGNTPVKHNISINAGDESTHDQKTMQTIIRKGINITVNDDTSDVNIVMGSAETHAGKIKMMVKHGNGMPNGMMDDIMRDGTTLISNDEIYIDDFNSLIPVLIRPASTTRVNSLDNRDYDNGVIMWYPKTPELERALQSSAVAGNSSVAQHNVALDNKMISNATIFPNPAKNETHVRYSLGEARSISFTIHNILGARIADLGEAVNQSAGLHEQNISVGNIPSGIYLLVITTDKGEQTMQRIVIEH